MRQSNCTTPNHALHQGFRTFMCNRTKRPTYIKQLSHSCRFRQARGERSKAAVQVHGSRRIRQTTCICDPRFESVDGAIQINPEGHKHGLGCDLDTQVLEQSTTDHWTLA